MTPEQISYVKNELERGVEEFAIKNIMLEHGYTPEQIEEIFAAVTQSQPIAAQAPAPSAVEREVTAVIETPKKSSAWLWIVLVVLGGVMMLGAGFFFVTNYQLQDARDAGNDAAMKAELNLLRTEAELYFDEGSTYVGFCETTAYDCEANGETYRFSGSLGDSSIYCVDSSGFSDTVLTAPEGTSCPF